MRQLTKARVQGGQRNARLLVSPQVVQARNYETLGMRYIQLTEL